MDIKMKVELYGAIGLLLLTYIYYLMVTTMCILSGQAFFYIAAILSNLFKTTLNHVIITRNTEFAKEIIYFEDYMDMLKGDPINHRLRLECLDLSYR